jgi:DNA-directed RNA polymerase sigma subunit (sigma70/sigma32)
MPLRQVRPLTERESLALSLRRTGATYREIGERMGVTGVRVRQLVVEGTRKLRLLDAIANRKV